MSVLWRDFYTPLLILRFFPGTLFVVPSSKMHSLCSGDVPIALPLFRGCSYCTPSVRGMHLLHSDSQLLLLIATILHGDSTWSIKNCLKIKDLLQVTLLAFSPSFFSSFCRLEANSSLLIIFHLNDGIRIVAYYVFWVVKT